jgi:hypothetical protein
MFMTYVSYKFHMPSPIDIFIVAIRPKRKDNFRMLFMLHKYFTLQITLREVKNFSKTSYYTSLQDHRLTGPDVAVTSPVVCPPFCYC